MADGIEQIESRLAAYIDGELADADRAEIEKYLAANPSHRQLIMELKQQRAQISSLPRESAPAEVLDHLQSHLERQALLENVEDGADSMRINRWPQWTAVAAMLLLTVGLGALVFSVLPGGALNHETVAIAPPTVQNLPAAPSLDAKEQDVESRDAVASAGTRRPDDADAFAGKGAGNSTEAEAEAAMGLAPRNTPEATPNEAMTMDLPGRPETGGGEPATVPGTEAVALYNGSAIIVSTDDPLITQNLLAGYLGQNKFDYTPVRAEIAKASVAASAQSASSSNSQASREGEANQEMSVQTPNVSSQQALGSIVARVNAKDNVVTNGEQYLLVRNLSPADAQRINTVINTQRGMRQQARFYDNRDLYPEFAQQAQQYAGQQQQPQQQMPLTQQRESLAENEQMVGDDRQRMSKSADAASPAAEAVPPPADQAAKPDAPAGIADLSPAPSRDEPSTQPTAEAQSLRTDVLIVVRNDPKLDAPLAAPASTQPSTQPATQPADQSQTDQTEQNVPAAPTPQVDTPLAPDLAPPASQPATQPVP